MWVWSSTAENPDYGSFPLLHPDGSLAKCIKADSTVVCLADGAEVDSSVCVEVARAQSDRAKKLMDEAVPLKR